LPHAALPVQVAMTLPPLDVMFAHALSPVQVTLQFAEPHETPRQAEPAAQFTSHDRPPPHVTVPHAPC
jgi:hypothetical protein